MSLPDFRALETGDVTDDDPQVLDDLIKQQANPVPPLPDEMTYPVDERPARLTRLQTGTQRVEGTGAGWEPVKILNPDAGRKSVVIAMNSADATDNVTIGEDPAMARNGGSLYQANPITLSGHTGAIWVYNPTANPITVSWFVVTA